MTMSEGVTPESWYKNLPQITRILVTAIFVVTLLIVMDLLDPRILILDFTLVAKKFHIWRLMSNYLFIGRFSMSWLFTMYFLCHFSTRLEQNELFTQAPGDYLYFMLIQMLSLDVLSLVLDFPRGYPFLAQSLSFAITYYWSKREAFGYLNYWGFTIQNYQFPFAMMFLNVLMGGAIWNDLVGLASGHLYYFLREVVPEEYGYNIIKTPQLCHKAMTKLRELTTAGGARGPAAPQSGPRIFGGAGHRLN